VLDDPAASVLNFTLTFQADFGQVYATNTTGFQQAFVAALSASTGGVATVSIVSITAGSIIVSTLVGFPPTGSACTAGALSPCGTFLATVSAAPGALFASQPMLASLPAAVLRVSVAYNGQTTQLASSTSLQQSPSLSVAAPPSVTSPASSRSSFKTIIGAAIAAGIVGPGTIISILACFFRPFLRSLLLKYGLTKLANLIVPDMEGDMDGIKEDLIAVKAFMARERSKIPPLSEQTPEISVGDVTIDSSVAPLGRGGFGVVYRAKLNQTTVVAVKTIFGHGTDPYGAVVPADVRKTMMREAKIMCHLNHPNVLRIFGVVPEKGWIVMELCTGGALSELLLDMGEALDAHTQLRFAAETATGVAYLHLSDVAIVHGDMKASNVLLTTDRSVRIADFGLAEAKDRSKTSSRIAGPSGFTTRWTAPEILKGEPKSFASDVFALGMTMYEIFERKRPFGSMTDYLVEREVVDGKRPSVGVTVPHLAAKLIHACWANVAKKRPSADTVAYSLTELLGDGVVVV
jgi:hypothetical protein